MSDIVVWNNIGPIGSIWPNLAFGVIGVLAALAVAFVIGIIFWPVATVRFVVWSFFTAFYRIRQLGWEKFPQEGGVVVVSNHVSWLDGQLMMLFCPRHLRIIVYSPNIQNRFMLRLARKFRAILIANGPRAIASALKEARDGLIAGDVVGIFPEGGITRSGNLMSFKPGLMKILKGTNANVVPVYIDGLWGSAFSFQGGKFFWKWPKRWRYPFTIHVGDPIENPQSLFQIRQAVQALGAKAVKQRMEKTSSIQQDMVRACKRRKFGAKVADSTGAEVTGGSFLMRALILRRILRRHVLQADENHVGILLPPSVPSMIVNLAVSLDRRVAINLNYTVSSTVMNQCIKQAGIKHVLTSRKVLEKLDLNMDADVICLEDFKEKATLGDKLIGALMAFVMPAPLVNSILKLGTIQADDILTIIFTSGSTGIPKGVMLTNSNIHANVKAVDQVVNLRSTDVIVGILPFFHSFGYTVTLWTVASLNIKGTYHFNPLDAKVIGKMIAKHKGTILLSTPTFLRSYLKRCSKEEFATLDTVVVGAEKLPIELSDAFEEKFGIRPTEGYGTTELSPLVSVNVPPSRSAAQSHQVDAKEGSVGRPVAGVHARVVSLESGEELGPNESGMLQISGHNVMKGYLNQPEKTAEVLQDGWYTTGDVAKIDDDGFIHITGRESRFSKIGGEMVPHIRIEEALQQMVGTDEENPPEIVVTAVPDAKKGERLIVVHTELNQSPQELCDGLRQQDFPNIFIPTVDSFVEVDQIPVLGTGKLDLKGIRDVALAKFGSK
ncbi:MAG: AMP-binding protein [Pirellulaceae bacterium]